MLVTPLLDATELVGLRDVFPNVPSAAWEPHRRAHPKLFPDLHSWRLDYTSYLIQAGGRTLLVDTGIGPDGSPLCAFARRPGGMLPEALRAAGVELLDVDVVVLTHLHPDHLGWNAVADGAGRRPTFPNAEYVCHQADWEAFRDPGPAVRELFPYPFFDDLVGCLEGGGHLRRIGGEAALADGVRAVPTFGHTPGSVSVVVESGDARAIMWGDVTANPAQVAQPTWDFLFDMDPAQARATRRELVADVEEGAIAVAAAHVRGFGHVERGPSGFHWAPLAGSGSLRRL